jgi:predicted AAA+ superfamily ATPase
MVRRTQKLSENNSLLLLGPRGVGKTTLLKSLFSTENTLWIDLLTTKDEERFGHHPDELSYELANGKYARVIIDEIQKAPKLLDIVHREIVNSKNKIQFVLTGSSARKLKRGAGNLLAGRAFLYYLFPFTASELKDDFDLNMALKYGTLPQVYAINKVEEKQEYLRSYVRTFIREEIQIEQLVRDLDPFRDFLEISAQMNGKIINFSKISREVGVEDKTIRSYYQILEDTLVGFFLPPFHRSIRKRQRESPKFYYFDTGVVRALDRTLTVELTPKTIAYGNAFEHFIISEVFRVCEYTKNDYRLSYLMTKDGVEIDLILERPGKPDLLVEIKSTDFVSSDDTKNLQKLMTDWDRECEAQVWSLDTHDKKIQSINCVFWKTGLKNI